MTDIAAPIQLLLSLANICLMVLTVLYVRGNKTKEYKQLCEKESLLSANRLMLAERQSNAWALKEMLLRMKEMPMCEDMKEYVDQILIESEECKYHLPTVV